MNESVEQMGDERPGPSLSRRGLFKYGLLAFSGLATTAGVLTPIVAYLWPPKQGGGATEARVAVASTADLPPGSGEVYSVANKPVLVIHTAHAEDEQTLSFDRNRV